MVGFYELMAHYRELTNAKGAFKITEKELGVFRELNPLNPQETAVFKLARKRFLEYTSAPKIFQVRDHQSQNKLCYIITQNLVADYKNNHTNCQNY